MADLLETRRKAIAKRTEIGFAPDHFATADEILSACEEATGYDVCPLPAGDPLLAGSLAVLDVSCQSIYQDQSRPAADRRYDAAHEYAHVWLHHGSCHCAIDDIAALRIGESLADSVRPASPAVDTDSVPGQLAGYSPRQRREQEANVFAAELLLPTPLARKLFIESKLTTTAIAEAIGIPTAVVEAQLVDAVLLPVVPESPIRSRSSDPDPSQIEAARVARGPLLIGAGPGTGKTSTLVARCLHLTNDRGVPPERILCLTFSRKAAAEMYERLLNAGVGTDSAGPWVGTFHSFGVEILRRFGEQSGLPADFRMLDTLDSFTLLENNLKELALVELDNLYDPTIHLRGILRQISRAHDEICSVDRYRELSERLLETAVDSGDAKMLRDGGRAVEVARCYEVYQRLKREAGVVDYGDLLHTAVDILRSTPSARARLRAEFPHVLADEYQDVNRACGELLKLVGGDDAHGTWVVGDWRQSIYRFRGASPANIGAFRRDYPKGRSHELATNYRSVPMIVDLVDSVGHEMRSRRAEGAIVASERVPTWTAHRPEDSAPTMPPVTIAAAANDSLQAAGIARTIVDLRNNGYRWCDQAILCRTHSQAASIVDALADAGIPAIYLGDLLERPEIKDLQCLLSLFADPHGAGLLRLGSLPEYMIPKADIRLALKRCRDSELWPSQALREPTLQEKVSPEGRPGLIRLAAHLKALETLQYDPASLLRHYLFGISDFLRHLSVDETPNVSPERAVVESFQHRLAVYQFLGVAASFNLRVIAPADASGATFNKVRPFLDYLRRAVAAGETPGSTLPDAVAAIDAVNVMTVHASKGLQFKAVFVPNLSDGQFPSRGRQDGIPEPLGLTDIDGQTERPQTDSDKIGDELCLFFVALSRAEDHLIVTRSLTKKDGSVRKQSPLLEFVKPWMEQHGIKETPWTEETVAAIGGTECIPYSPPDVSANADLPADEETGSATSTDTLPIYSQRSLDVYMACPRQYYYQNVARIGGSPIRGAYPKFHACVHETLRWIDTQRNADIEVDAAVAFDKLNEIWQDRGPVGHLHEESYRLTARRLLTTALATEKALESVHEDRTLVATLTNARVRVEPDVVADAVDGTLIVARRRTGKRGESDHTDPWVALARQAAKQSYPDRAIRLEYRYLQDGTTIEFPEPPTPHKRKLEQGRVDKYDTAAAGIVEKEFPPLTSDRCNSCPFWTVCPG